MKKVSKRDFRKMKTTYSPCAVKKIVSTKPKRTVSVEFLSKTNNKKWILIYGDEDFMLLSTKEAMMWLRDQDTYVDDDVQGFLECFRCGEFDPEDMPCFQKFI